MSLRTKIVYILLAVVVLYAGVDNGTLRLFAARIFSNWEHQEAQEKLSVVLRAVEEEVEDLAEKGSIWASLESMADFVRQEDPEFAAEFVRGNLGERALESSAVHVFYVCDRSGKVLFGSIRDPQSGETIRLTKDLPNEALSASSRLVSIRSEAEASQGVMTTERWPLLISSTPIRGADGQAFEPDDGSRFRAVKHGYVILGRFMDEGLLANIGAPAGFDIRLLNLDKVQLTAQESDLIAGLTTREEIFPSYVDSDGDLHMYAGVFDLRTGQPTVLEAVTEQEIVAAGRRAVNYALLSTLAAALLILFVLLRLLGRFVLRPLGTLTAKAVEIGRTDDTTIRVGMERTDELGQLSAEFDRMLDKLADSRAQVVKTARKAGMSEIATGVLHNVGNVLNSVNVSANLAAKSVGELSVDDLDRMVGMLPNDRASLVEFIKSDPRGEHFIPFLTGLSESLGTQKARVLEELVSLGTGIEHIADLVRSQQSYAGTKGVYELAALRDELDAAVQICARALGTLDDVKIEREYEELPTVKVDKHKLMEILVNLIQNACDAMRDAGGEEMCMTLRLTRASESSVRIEVQDNGVGIREEDLDRVFKHGFTTKEDGHGFGLHVSANAATEMNASLKVRSDGSGKGATFYLELPAAEAALASAA